MSNQKEEFVAHYRPSDGVIQDVWSHLENVGQRTARIAEKIGLGPVGELLGLVHDFGKANSPFDSYIRHAVGLPLRAESDSAKIKETVDHSTAGSVWVRSLISADPKARLSQQLIPLIAVSHHSGLIDCLTMDGQDGFERRLNKNELQIRMKESLGNAPPDYIESVNRLVQSGNIESLLADSIHSLREPSDGPNEMAFKVGLLTRFLFSALIDGDRIDTIDFQYPEQRMLRRDGVYHPWDTMIGSLENHLKKFSCQNHIDKLRQDVSRRCLEVAHNHRGIYRLTVPTGGGKTLASLRFALHHARHHGLERILYVIPYTSIIDQNASTIKDIIEAHPDCKGMVLEHHSNLEPDRQNSPEQKLFTQNWDAPIVLTTMVQFLEALFGSGTTKVRRMHQMANAVIIFDEIQTLPIRCIHMFNLALRFLVNHCGSTAVLCTATQPLLHTVKPRSRALPDEQDAEITPDVKSMFAQFKRVHLQDRTDSKPWSHEELAMEILEQWEQKRSVLAILNTKRDALRVYQKLSERESIPIWHLSTSMCPAHRLSVLGKINRRLEDKEPIICISTQLIEAGVDLDFDVAFRALAGLDSIQQAAGRCNRHGRNAFGNVFIFELAGENLSRLPDIRMGKEITQRILGEFRASPADFDHDLLSPRTMDRYYHYYFYQRQHEMDYPLIEKSPAGLHDSLFRLLSTNDISVKAYKRQYRKAPPLLLRQAFQTAAESFKAIEQSSRGVIVPYGQEGEGNEIIADLCALEPWDNPRELLVRAQQYSVGCFPYVMEALDRQRVLHRIREDIEIFFVDESVYCDDVGLLDEPSNDMGFLEF
ncbi:MAG: CRISPR-associated helicase Cas3' [Firmicutes bacterium]|nr:CRISPR-associated helicase Cas3' [Bacillota bacterium]